MRYQVERLPGTLTFRVLDTKTYATVVRMDNDGVEHTTFEDRVDANRVAANLNRTDAEQPEPGWYCTACGTITCAEDRNCVNCNRRRF